jgi:hypothetical protein
MAKTPKPRQGAGARGRQPAPRTERPRAAADGGQPAASTDGKAGTKGAAGRDRQPARTPSGRPGAPRKPAGGGPKGAAARRAAEQRRRRRTIAYTALTVGIIGALVAFIVLNNRNDTGGQTEDDFKARQATLAGARSEAGCTDIQTFPQAGRNHIAPNVQPTNWNSNPPTSGDHLATPLPGGVYPTEQDERMVVHSLEHGYVAIQYKNIPADQLAQLRAVQAEHADSKLILMPYSGLEKDGVALSAWQHDQVCGKVNRQVVEAFVDAFMLPDGRQSVAPEPFAA